MLIPIFATAPARARHAAARGVIPERPRRIVVMVVHAEHNDRARVGEELRGIDPAIGIAWPLNGEEPILSPKDAVASLLADAEVYEEGQG